MRRLYLDLRLWKGLQLRRCCRWNHPPDCHPNHHLEKDFPGLRYHCRGRRRPQRYNVGRRVVILGGRWQ